MCIQIVLHGHAYVFKLCIAKQVFQLNLFAGQQLRNIKLRQPFFVLSRFLQAGIEGLCFGGKPHMTSLQYIQIFVLV